MRPHRQASHTVYDVKVHLIWTTTYRDTMLTKEVGLGVLELIRQMCDANRMQSIRGRVSQNHVHVSVSYPPKPAVSEMVRL